MRPSYVENRHADLVDSSEAMWPLVGYALLRRYICED